MMDNADGNELSWKVCGSGISSKDKKMIIQRCREMISQQKMDTGQRYSRCHTVINVDEGTKTQGDGRRSKVHGDGKRSKTHEVKGTWRWKVGERYRGDIKIYGDAVKKRWQW